MMEPNNNFPAANATGSNPDPTQQKIRQWLNDGYTLLEKATASPESAAIAQCSQALELFKAARDIAATSEEYSTLCQLALADAFSQRGHHYRYSRNHASALADLSQAIRLNPDASLDYFYRALSYLARRETKLARADLTSYLQRGQSDYLRQLARTKLANLAPEETDQKALLSHHRSQGARLVAEATEFMQPRDETAPPNWLEAIKTFHRARAAFDNALQVNRSDLQTKFSLLGTLVEQAQCYRRVSDFSQALANYDRARQIMPQPRLLFYKAETLLEMGDTKAARPLLEEYLKRADQPEMEQQAQIYLDKLNKTATQA